MGQPGFLFGAVSSAHQVEGNNMNSDWWAYEQQGKLPKSGNAADHYNRFEEDFAIAKRIGLNAMRVSIEWSRIEPAEGKWNSAAIEHYRKVLLKMKELGLARMITLHHFTLPAWLAEKGGFEKQEGVEAFARFAWFVAQNLGSEIDYWCLINEPGVFATMGHVHGKWPPFKTGQWLAAIKLLRNLIRAHNKAYEAIKLIIPEAKIGVAKEMAYFEPFRPKNVFDKVLVWGSKKFGNEYFLSKTSKHLDFIGINYYFFNLLKFRWPNNWEDMNYNFVANRPEEPGAIQRSDMGWRTFPEGLYHLLMDLKKFGKPIYITENGIANARDDMRKDFVKQHLEAVKKAKASGCDVRGYFYWSLTDTYEWDDGFNPKFGLVEVNFETQERRIRPSAGIFNF